MQYYIEHSDEVTDKKDIMVDRHGDFVFACERAHFRVIPPEMEYTTEKEEEKKIMVNKQGTDTLTVFGTC